MIKTLKIAALCLALSLLVCALPALASEPPALTVRVSQNGEAATVARLTKSELAALGLETHCYSSTNAAAAPLLTLAEGVPISSILELIGVAESETESLAFESSDGWRRSFPAADYLSERRYFPNIVSHYDTASENPPEFLVGAEDGAVSVKAVLALKSTSGRFMSEPDASLLTEDDGLRFCFGQNEIEDSVSVEYGKNITVLTVALSEGSAYMPPETVIGSGVEQETPEGVDEETENEGLIADTLTITVGYFGGPYFTKKVFTLDELYSMDVVEQVYSYIDNMPSVVMESVRGVRLSDILAAAGIDANSVESMHFYCSDVVDSWYVSIPRDYLLDTTRYYYPHLAERWDYDEAAAGDYSTEGAVEVDTLIALEDNWKRFALEGSFESLTTANRFRLVFGQTSVSSPNASRSARWIHTIQVMLGGTAPEGVTLDESVLELEVGSEFQLTANVAAADSTTDTRVLWSSSDTGVAVVDSGGRVEIVGEGTAVITATTAVGGKTASVVINPQTEPETIAEPEPPAPETPAETPPETLPEPQTPTEPESESVSESAPEPAPGETMYSVDSPQDAQEAASAVQNWRVYEMSETAVALPELKTDDSMNTAAGIAAAAFFVLGAALTIIRFKTQTGGKKSNDNRRP